MHRYGRVGPSATLTSILAALVAGGLALSACTGSTSGHESLPPSPSVDTTQCSTQPNERTDLLALKMTAALQKHDKAALLALFGSSVRGRVGTWYDNVNAIGFTTAAVGSAVSDTGVLEHSAPKTQQVTLAVGLHNKFDETLGEGGGPDAPATQYTLDANVVHDANGACHLSATSWKPQNDAPWDSSERLTVVHTAHTVVAGDPEVAAQVRRTARIAETAAKFEFAFYKHVGSAGDIDLHGFVLFVPKSVAENDAWFSYKNAKRPTGWTADVGRNAAGVEYPLYGAQIPVTQPPGAPHVAKVSQIGGGRVVITRTGLAASVHDQTATLVHEFTHDVYNNYDDGWFTGKPVDAALTEGAARYIETFYRISPNPNDDKAHSMSLLAPVVRTHFSSFRGAIPTSGQIYGSASTADYYYDLSATCFSYLAGRYGLHFALQSIRNAYANGGGPFAGIVTSNKGGNIVFAAPDAYVKPWAAWLRTQIR